MKKYTLPKEFGKKWIAALRSGEYKQGQQTLCSYADSKYCCLGVAAKISGANFLEIVGKQWVKLDSDLNLPSVLKGSGANSDLVYDLVSLNDHENKSFPEIADWIESNVELN